ncbi:hypothetical protein Lal_00041159 [Lupinus albus]|nr:hypothetical protein Lal_00041159 [Lupinus albus]
MDHLDPAVVMLDDAGAGFHPVAGVEVAQVADGAVGRVVDVAADHPLRPPAAGLLGQDLLELADEADGVLHLQLGPGRERPVGQAQTAAEAVEDRVQPQGQGVGPVAEMGEPALVAHHHVELVAMDDEVARPSGESWRAVSAISMPPKELVVVARQVDDVRPLADLAQELLHHVVMGLRPVPAGAELPAVDDVADEVDGVRVVVPQEAEQHPRLAPPGAEVQIGQEQGADADRPVVVLCHSSVSLRNARGSRARLRLGLMTLPVPRPEATVERAPIQPSRSKVALHAKFFWPPAEDQLRDAPIIHAIRRPWPGRRWGERGREGGGRSGAARIGRHIGGDRRAIRARRDASGTSRLPLRSAQGPGQAPAARAGGPARQFPEARHPDERDTCRAGPEPVRDTNSEETSWPQPGAPVATTSSSPVRPRFPTG